METNDVQLITTELLSVRALKEMLHLNQRYDRLPKITFPEEGFLYFDN